MGIVGKIIIQVMNFGYNLIAMCSAGAGADAALLQRLRGDRNLRRRMRPISMGTGLRVRDCSLCGANSNAPDVVFPEHSFTLWAHMETTAPMTIQGFVDLYCNGILRRAYKGWKAKELRAKFDEDPAEKERFEKLRAQEVERFRSWGPGGTDAEVV